MHVVVFRTLKDFQLRSGTKTKSCFYPNQQPSVPISPLFLIFYFAILSLDFVPIHSHSAFAHTSVPPSWPCRTVATGVLILGDMQSVPESRKELLGPPNSLSLTPCPLGCWQKANFMDSSMILWSLLLCLCCILLYVYNLINHRCLFTLWAHTKGQGDVGGLMMSGPVLALMWLQSCVTSLFIWFCAWGSLALGLCVLWCEGRGWAALWAWPTA